MNGRHLPCDDHWKRSIRSALFEWLSVVSSLCVCLFTDRAPVMFSHFSLLSVINGSRVLSPLLGSVWAALHSEMDKHQSSSRRWCQSRYCFNKPPWVSVTCLWTCSGAHTAVSQRLHVISTTPFCSLTLTPLVLMSALKHKPTTINNRADHIQWVYNQQWVWLNAKM